MDRIAPKPPIAIDGPIVQENIKPTHLTQRLTRTEDLFVLVHTAVPQVEAADWSLEICGLVGRELTISFEELLGYPKRTLEAIQKCSGNPFEPTKPTRQIANVKWGGVDLRDLLADVEIDPSATHLWTYGLDYGVFAENEVSHYRKDLPLSRVEEGDILIAYELNEQPLSPQHGFPARLVVPGYYGTNSVKWICRLELADHRAQGLFTTELYNDPTEDGKTKPVWEVEPESIFVSPAPGETLSLQGTEIWGWAWSSAEVMSVDVSFDGGKTWNVAQVEPRYQRSWQKFSIDWQPSRAGEYELQCCATDAQGRTQPASDARHAIYSVKVIVEP